MKRKQCWAHPAVRILLDHSPGLDTVQQVADPDAALQKSFLGVARNAQPFLRYPLPDCLDQIVHITPPLLPV